MTRKNKSVQLESGTSLWNAAELHYGGAPPLEAIYQANGLLPRVTRQDDGRIAMEDPLCGAGSFIFPEADEIDSLTKEYNQATAALGQNSTDRVGTESQSTHVKLIYGDTFWALAETKYGGNHPIAAIYEANQLTPPAVDIPSRKILQDPIYFAGQLYRLPATDEIPELEARFWKRLSDA
jgi:hypothetical protein